ncbi:MAG: hypothetical protein FWC25_03095 [Dehalococcoidia bacterium]|nr:hypothetical protein [Dehalococcoidia bacterium]
MPELAKTVLTTTRVTAAARSKAKEEIIQRLEILTPADWVEISERVGFFGKPALDYLKYQEKIKVFIEKNKILPIEQLKPDSGWIHGGKFVEFRHVHLNKNIYPLNDTQFAALDKELVKEFNFSLKNASTVKF